jgi:PAS domain S-box-containing protein
MSIESLTPIPGRIAQALGRMRTAFDVPSEFLEALPIGIYACDIEGRILWFNRRAVQIWGREPRTGDSTEKYCGSYKVYFNGHQISREETPMAAVLRTGIAVQGAEGLVERPDGSRVWARVHIEPVKDEDGAIVGAINCFHETTDLYEAEHAAQRLAAIVESSDDAIVSKNLDGIITSWNRGAERIFDYKAEEVIGKPVTILMPPDRVNEEPGILERIRRGERIDHYETVRCRKDGTPLDISLTVSPLKDRDGRVIGASKIARDITRRKRAEAELRGSEQRLQDLLSAIPAAIYTTDAAGRITYYNESAVELAGRRPKIGSDEWCVTWKLYRPDGTPLPHHECPMAVALREGRPIRNAEAIAERPDGSRIPFIPYPTPMRDADGQVVGAINMLVDISERREAETQQRVLLRELNHRVKNNMQMLQSLLYAATKKTQNTEAQRILDEASSRITAMAAAQQVLYGATSAMRFHAKDFLESVCQAAQHTFPPHIRIVREAASGELPNDSAMPLALILNEFLTNAVKHGCDRAAGAVIRVGLATDGSDFVLFVQDDGPGFDPQSVTKKASGLQLVRLLARQLRGEFVVTKNPTRCSLRFQ